MALEEDGPQMNADEHRPQMDADDHEPQMHADGRRHAQAEPVRLEAAANPDEIQLTELEALGVEVDEGMEPTPGLAVESDGPREEGGPDGGARVRRESRASVRRARFAPLAQEPVAAGGPSNIDLLMEVALKISVELGRASLTVRDTLNLGPGHVIELDKLAGDPVDVLVNGRLIARGEVVVVDDQFGVRITEIVSTKQRVEAMG